MRSRARNLGWALLLAAATPLPAGTISLAWTPVTSATGYRIYYGQSSGEYAEVKDVGNVTQTTLGGLDDCESYYVAIKAYNFGGESPSFSNEISGWARPSLTSPSPAARPQGAEFTLQVLGANFQPGAVVELEDPNVVVRGATRVSCRRFDLELAIAPAGPGLRAARAGALAVSVTNPDGTFGRREQGFEIQLDPARFDVNRSNAGTRGRIDGQDTVWMARLFGSREADPLYEPDFDLDGDGWVDGEDLAHIASNLGRCWSGAAWTLEACTP